MAAKTPPPDNTKGELPLTTRTERLITKLYGLKDWKGWALILLAPLVLFIGVKLCHYKWHLGIEWVEAWECLMHDAVIHLDIVGYWIGAIGIALGIYIALRVNEGADKKLKDIQEVSEQVKGQLKVMDEAAARLGNQVREVLDAERGTITSIPMMLREIEQLLNEADKNEGELYIMNKTSAFGYIHTFNPRFVHQFTAPPWIGSGPAPSDDEYCKRLLMMVTQVQDIEALVEKICLRQPEVRILTYSAETDGAGVTPLIKFFTETYLNVEDDAGQALRLYDMTGRVIKLKPEPDREKRLRFINEQVTSHHKRAIARYEEKRIEGHLPTCVVQMNHEAHIPMQVYATRYKRVGELRHLSLMIFAVDTPVEVTPGYEPAPSETNTTAQPAQQASSSNTARTLVAVRSETETMFNVFRTFFDQKPTA